MAMQITRIKDEINGKNRAKEFKKKPQAMLVKHRETGNEKSTLAIMNKKSLRDVFEGIDGLCKEVYRG